MFVEVDGDVGEAFGRARSLNASRRRGETTHENAVLAGAFTGLRKVRHVLHVVFERRDIQLGEGFSSERLNRDRNVLGVFRTALSRHNDFLNRVGTGIGGIGRRGSVGDSHGRAAQDRGNRVR